MGGERGTKDVIEVVLALRRWTLCTCLGIHNPTLSCSSLVCSHLGQRANEVSVHVQQVQDTVVAHQWLVLFIKHKNSYCNLGVQ